VVERRHLGEPGRFPVGDPVAESGLHVAREFFEHNSIIPPAKDQDQAHTGDRIT
jgi:hypothetical protein